MSEKLVNIYLVDDNDIDLAVNTKLLRLTDLAGEITSFSSAKKFLDAVGNIPGLSNQTNIVLLDIMMPGMDGFECIEEFGKLPDEVTSLFMVFMLSSSIDRNDIRRAENSKHVIRVLEKPLDVYLLKRLIRDRLQDQQNSL